MKSCIKKHLISLTLGTLLTSSTIFAEMPLSFSTSGYATEQEPSHNQEAEKKTKGAEESGSLKDSSSRQEPNKEPKSEECPVNTDPSSCLSLDPSIRDQQLRQFYVVAIPILIGWDLAHDYVLKGELTSSEVLEEFIFPPVFQVPYPGSPYRQPGADKVESIPKSNKEWKNSVKSWKKELEYRETLIKLGEDLLKEAQEHDSVITIRGDEKLFSEGLLMRALSYNETEFYHTENQQYKAVDILKNPELGNKVDKKLTRSEIEALQQFVTYHKKQAEIFKTFLAKFEKETFANALLDPEMKNYYIPGGKSAHSLINVEPLQMKERGDAEVIVFDWGVEKSSHHVNYIDHKPSNKHPHKTSHGEQVSGVLAAKGELAQLKGVAPGARVLAIGELTPTTIKQMSQSNARVINISAMFTFPKSCAPVFDQWGKNQKSLSGQSILDEKIDPYCKTLWDFVEMVQNKDMIVVMSAGNEGLEVEKNDWTTGKVDRNLTDGILGKQYYTLWLGDEDDEDDEDDSGFSPYGIDLIHISEEIPQLKGRLIFVGNLWNDGVTVAQGSSLPGAFPNDFIYAPSEGISSVGSSVIGSRIKAKKDPENPTKFLKDEHGKNIPELDDKEQVVREDVYGGIEEFGGTSGAAPRVSGVFVLLGKLFPDLSMPEIRQCVLETGDAFWVDPNNRFTWLQTLAKEAGYDLKSDQPKDKNKKELWDYMARIYGRGRINAMSAYDCSLKRQEAKRQKGQGATRSALDLAKAQPLKKR